MDLEIDFARLMRLAVTRASSATFETKASGPFLDTEWFLVVCFGFYFILVQAELILRTYELFNLFVGSNES